MATFVAWLAITIVPIILVGVFTDFSTGTEKTIQTGWILAWIVVGSASSLWVTFLEKHARRVDEKFLLSTPMWVPAVGGLVVVGQIFGNFGVCTKFRSS
jgi:hypothetical protein